MSTLQQVEAEENHIQYQGIYVLIASKHRANWWYICKWTQPGDLLQSNKLYMRTNETLVG